MKMATFFSLALGLIVFAVAAATSANNPWIYLNLHATLVVFGGTLSAAAISFGFQRLYNLTKILSRRMFRGDKIFQPQVLIKNIMHLSDLYKNHPEKLKQEISLIEDHFLKEAMILLTDNYLSQEDLVRIMKTRTLSIYQRYHDEALKFRALAKFPPAFGLMGAVLGMIGIMAELGSAGAANTMGPSLALALVGTLYGVALANLVVLPLAENLQDSAREIYSKNTIITEAINLMLEKKSSILMAEDLNSFVLANERLDWKKLKSQERSSYERVA